MEDINSAVGKTPSLLVFWQCQSQTQIKKEGPWGHANDPCNHRVVKLKLPLLQWQNAGLLIGSINIFFGKNLVRTKTVKLMMNLTMLTIFVLV